MTREEKLAYTREWAKSDVGRAWHKAWREKNREKRRAQDRERAAKFRAENPEIVKALAKAWYDRNPEKVQAWKARYYEANAEACREYTREWIKANPEKAATNKHNRRVRVRSAEGSHTAKEWGVILEAHGHRCAHCKCDGPLTRDHIIPLSKGGTNYASNLQPLCRSCNSSKREFIRPPKAKVAA